VATGDPSPITAVATEASTVKAKLLMALSFETLSIPEIVLVKPHTIGDERGWFRETYKADAYADAGIPAKFVQDNSSSSVKGVLRGLHFQRAPFAQAKLVSVAFGEVFDVAVDIRVGSPTFGKWVGETLSAENGNQLWIPTGFAHGFFVTSETATLTYKVTAPYSGPSDGGTLWNDPAIGIEWPEGNPLLSDKDQRQPVLAECDHGFVYEFS
jgi:dTDP-4-dehydrorhamnose 3,5-epimerase